jgi:predicted DNA-binding transcriptional regulator YafY
LAKIKVRTGTTAAMHFESDVHENGIVELNYLDLPLLAEELMEFGSAVEVIEPLELKKLLSETLRSVIANHA